MKAKLITRGVFHEWAREAENDWVFRIFGLPLDITGVSLVGFVKNQAILFCAGKKVSFLLTDPEMIVLKSWLFGTEEDQTGKGVGLVITDPERKWFLLQRKDDKHPNIDCRGRLCLISGSVAKDEKPDHAVLRELFEEIISPDLANAIARVLSPFASEVLPSVQWSGTYLLSAFLAIAPNGQDFSWWKDKFMDDPGLSESTPCLLSKEKLLEMIDEELKNPGRHFVASHHVILGKMLKNLP